jgi:hypothetical protein
MNNFRYLNSHSKIKIANQKFFAQHRTPNLPPSILRNKLPAVIQPDHRPKIKRNMAGTALNKPGAAAITRLRPKANDAMGNLRFANREWTNSLPRGDYLCGSDQESFTFRFSNPPG